MEFHVHVKRALLLLNFCVWVSTEVIGMTKNDSAPSTPREVNIGALFTFNSTIGRSAKPALLGAIEYVNSDSTILNDTKINLILQDTDCNGFLGTIEGNISS